MKPAQQRSRHLAPGDKLGKYDLIRQIAIGGMAELYLARTVGIEGFEKLVVVKRILPQFASSSSFVNMFLNEARLAATLHHPNVAQVYDIGVEDGDYFFAMEYVHGEDLDRITTQSHEQGVPISMDAALTLITGLCAGLHYAHEKTGPDGQPLGIVHRDVSPSNVLVSYDGSVKLVDFGIARAFSSKSTSTQGGLKGKITYMSPEQVRSDGVLDRRSDQYSIGTLLYELTTGRTPFTGETEYAILNQIVNSDVPPPSRIVPSYPPALERIVMRALCRDPAGRYATSVQLQGELEDFAHENRLRVSPLVLARLMGTLFPARLEEWDNAKSQGAFFVEQHVVRTLIESGRTPDPGDPQTREQIQEVQRYLAEEDPTAITNPPVDVNTEIGPPPVAVLRMTPPAGSVRPPTPRPTTPAIPARMPTPPRATRMPTPVAPLVVTSRAFTPMPATAGVLVSHPNETGVVAAPAPQQADVTERVRGLRAASPTKLVRTGAKSRAAIVIGVLLVVIGGGAAIFIGLVNSGPATDKAAPTSQPSAADPKAAAVKPEPAKPEAETTEAKGEHATTEARGAETPPEPAKIEAKPEPAKVEAKPEPVKTEAKPEPAKTDAKPDDVPKPKHVKRTPKPKPKPDDTKPEEKPWNADSPFMPVRTDKR